MICLTFLAYVAITNEGPALLAVMNDQPQCETRLAAAEIDAGCQDWEFCFTETETEEMENLP